MKTINKIGTSTKNFLANVLKKEEPVYQYRQKGTEEWVTCTKEMYDKLRDKYINSYDMRVS